MQLPFSILSILLLGLMGFSAEIDHALYMINNTFLRSIDPSLNHLYSSNHSKVLLYFTTSLEGHFQSRHHPKANQLPQFKYLWPFALRKSDLLRNADVLIHASVTFNDHTPIHDVMNKTTGMKYVDATPEHLCRGLTQAVRSFPNCNVTILFMENPGYQGGAIKAMVDGYQQGWFAPYDWVIRLNGDTMIYDDTRLTAFMQESECNAVFSNCATSPDDPVKLMSDFFAFRPDRVDYSMWRLDWWSRLNAERWTTAAFQSVVEKQKHRWIQSLSKSVYCRVMQQDIAHQHFCWHDQIYRLLNPADNSSLRMSNEPCIDN